MSKNLGKIFEENFKKSIPEEFFSYKLRDSGGNWNRTEKSTFTITNICDFIVFEGQTLFLLELKNHKGKSIPLDAIIGRKSKKKQMEDLYFEYNKDIPIWAGLIVFFSDEERCFSLDINKFKDFTLLEDRKSIPLYYFEENGIEIEVVKLKTNYRYNIEKWMGEIL